MLQIGRGNAAEEIGDDWVCLDPSSDVVVDTMLEVLDYTKWINNIFELKRRIRTRRKVRVRKAPAPPASAPEAAGNVIEVVVPEGMEPGQSLPVTYQGQKCDLVVPEGVGPGMTFHAAVPPASGGYSH